MKLSPAERDLLAKAVVFTRRSAFTDAERLTLVTLIGRLSVKWDQTRGAYALLSVRVQRRAEGHVTPFRS